MRKVLMTGLLLLSSTGFAQTKSIEETDVLSATKHLIQYSEERQPCTHYTATKQPFFGDLHVHTRYSLDANTQGTRTTPSQAYEFAKGQPLGLQPWSDSGEPGRSIQLQRPLDFAMVSDHAELLGEVEICSNSDLDGYSSLECKVFRNLPRVAFYAFNYTAAILADRLWYCDDDGEDICKLAGAIPWKDHQDSAEKHYDRSSGCDFTAFVGYEWTGATSNSGNLHRNVIFRNADVPKLPWSFIDDPTNSGLWKGLKATCTDGVENCDVFAIPHNSNISDGEMFSMLGDDGAALSKEDAELRAIYEPLVEIFQHKGDSECFYQAGVTEDELCAFENLPDGTFRRGSALNPNGGFIRQVLNEGMQLEQKLGINPFKFGMIASTDTHLGAPGAVNESIFVGHGGAGVPARDKVPPGIPDNLEYNPGGLAVVWAEENSRDALFNAMRRKETYGTSGPRIVTRLFAGQNLPENMCDQPNFAEVGYRDGVPMGSDIAPDADGKTPRIAFYASQDVGTSQQAGMPLQALQIIKGWIDDKGEKHERVVSVAGNRDNGAAVNEQTCEVSGEGYASLCTVWADESFDATQQAYYYGRVIENPSCRWSQRMCVAKAVDCADPNTISEGMEGCCAESHRPVIQERAWTSPVWYKPS